MKLWRVIVINLFLILLVATLVLGSISLINAVSGTWAGTGNNAASGDYTALSADDTTYWAIGRTRSGTISGNMSVAFTFSEIYGSINNITIDTIYCHDGSNSAPAACDGDAAEGTPGADHGIFVYNWDTTSWDEIGTLSTADGGTETSSSITLTGDSYVNSTTGQILVNYEVTWSPGPPNDAWLVLDYSTVTVDYVLSELNSTILSPTTTRLLTIESGDYFELECSVENTGETAETITIYQQFNNGTYNNISTSSSKQIYSNQTSSYACGSIPVGNTCSYTTKIYGGAFLEDGSVSCYALSATTSDRSSETRVDIASINDFSIGLDKESYVVDSASTAEITSKITNIPYNVTWYNSYGSQIDGCSFSGTTPGTASSTFYQSCTIPANITTTNNYVLVYFNNNAQYNFTDTFSVAESINDNEFAFVGLEQTSFETFLGKTFSISAQVIDSNSSVAVDECCMAQINDATTNAPIFTSEVHRISERCSVSFNVDPTAFKDKTSYKIDLIAWQCNDDTLPYSYRKRGITSTSLYIDEFLTVTTPTTNTNIFAGLDDVIISYNTTNNYDEIIQTVTDSWIVNYDTNQDYHFEELKDIKGTANVGLSEITYKLQIPSSLPSGNYTIETLVKMYEYGCYIGEKKIITQPFIITSINDTIDFNGLYIYSGINDIPLDLSYYKFTERPENVGLNGNKLSFCFNISSNYPNDARIGVERVSLYSKNTKQQYILIPDTYGEFKLVTENNLFHGENIICSSITAPSDIQEGGDYKLSGLAYLSDTSRAFKEELIPFESEYFYIANPIDFNITTTRTELYLQDEFPITLDIENTGNFIGNSKVSITTFVNEMPVYFYNTEVNFEDGEDNKSIDLILNLKNLQSYNVNEVTDIIASGWLDNYRSNVLAKISNSDQDARIVVRYQVGDAVYSKTFTGYTFKKPANIFETYITDSFGGQSVNNLYVQPDGSLEYYMYFNLTSEEYLPGTHTILDRNTWVTVSGESDAIIRCENNYNYDNYNNGNVSKKWYLKVTCPKEETAHLIDNNITFYMRGEWMVAPLTWNGVTVNNPTIINSINSSETEYSAGDNINIIINKTGFDSFNYKSEIYLINSITGQDYLIDDKESYQTIGQNIYNESIIIPNTIPNGDYFIKYIIKVRDQYNNIAYSIESDDSNSLSITNKGIAINTFSSDKSSYYYGDPGEFNVNITLNQFGYTSSKTKQLSYTVQTTRDDGTVYKTKSGQLNLITGDNILTIKEIFDESYPTGTYKQILRFNLDSEEFESSSNTFYINPVEQELTEGWLRIDREDYYATFNISAISSGNYSFDILLPETFTEHNTPATAFLNNTVEIDGTPVNVVLKLNNWDGRRYLHFDNLPLTTVNQEFNVTISSQGCTLSKIEYLYDFTSETLNSEYNFGNYTLHQLHEASGGSNFSSVLNAIAQNYNSILEIINTQDLQYAFNEEQVFLIVDAMNELKETYDEVSNGTITEEEARVKIQSVNTNIENAIVKQTDSILALEEYRIDMYNIGYTTAPRVTVYDPKGNKMIENVPMKEDTIRYTFRYQTNSNAIPGIWRTEITTQNGVIKKQWSLQNNPTMITVMAKNGACEMDILNEGSSEQEYNYIIYITENDKIIDSKEGTVTLNPSGNSLDYIDIPELKSGNYYCKSEVNYGIGKSTSSNMFTIDSNKEIKYSDPLIEIPVKTKPLNTVGALFIMVVLGLLVFKDKKNNGNEV